MTNTTLIVHQQRHKSLAHAMPVYDSTSQWIHQHTNFNETLAKEVLIQEKLSFLVDESFFLIRSHLIAAHIILLKGKQKLNDAQFILLVALPHCNAYSAELCGTLAILKLTKYLISLLTQKLDKYKIEVDCYFSSVLDFYLRILK